MNKIIISKTDYPQVLVRMGSIYINLEDTLVREIEIDNILKYIFYNNKRMYDDASDV